MAQATVTAIAKIDISPQGVCIILEGIDNDLANLLSKGKNFICGEPVYRSYDTSDVMIKTRQTLQFVEPVEIETATADITIVEPKTKSPQGMIPSRKD